MAYYIHNALKGCVEHSMVWLSEEGETLDLTHAKQFIESELPEYLENANAFVAYDMADVIEISEIRAPHPYKLKDKEYRPREIPG